MSALTSLPNIGPKTAQRLAELGIENVASLRRLGAVVAFKRLKHAFPRETSLNALYALQAALEGIPWLSLPLATRESLRTQISRKR